MTDALAGVALGLLVAYTIMSATWYLIMFRGFYRPQSKIIAKRLIKAHRDSQAGELTNDEARTQIAIASGAMTGMWWPLGDPDRD